MNANVGNDALRYSLDCIADKYGTHLLVCWPGRALARFGAVAHSVGPRVKIARGAHGEGGRGVTRTTTIGTGVPVCLGALGSLHENGNDGNADNGLYGEPPSRAASKYSAINHVDRAAAR